MPAFTRHVLFVCILCMVPAHSGNLYDLDHIDEKPKPPLNRFDLSEWTGAFGDLGTLIPFVAAYVSILKMDANGLLVAFGVALIVVGSIYRTPFPVQPMKAIGAAAVSQTALAAGLGPAVVIGAAVMTGLMWMLLALTGIAGRLANWVPRPALMGVVMGLGFSCPRRSTPFSKYFLRMSSASSYSWQGCNSAWEAGTLELRRPIASWSSRRRLLPSGTSA